MKTSMMKLLFNGVLLSVLNFPLAVFAAAPEETPLFRGADGKELPTRQILNKGDTLEVFYDSCIISGKIEFKETERSSKIHDDLVALAKKIADNKSDGGKCGEVSQKYVTKYKRSQIELVAVSAANKPLGTKTLIVGPAENVSLGLNLPVNNRKTLKYDSASGKLLPQDESPFMYLSLDFTPGDILTSPDESRNWQDRINFKVMVEASSHPLDSYGIGIGYRLPTIASMDLTGISVFVGYFRAKEDTLNAGVAAPNQGRKNSVRWGLSYDLGTALKWAKF
ncbi:hypothetical protein [Pseudoduganella rhizocola]|uniref:hypothetical protein n=1 Tax=Pseudoduganella rhizocola TaxID=3382643 RepID=UPI0038B4C936